MSSPLSTHLLRAEGICKTYKTRTVVVQVSLTVGHGEIVGLLGPHGAGKTTSFYMVAGLVRPDEGRVIFAGENITELPMNPVSYTHLDVYKRQRQRSPRPRGQPDAPLFPGSGLRTEHCAGPGADPAVRHRCV